jgi:hypothetical protein
MKIAAKSTSDSGTFGRVKAGSEPVIIGKSWMISNV